MGGLILVLGGVRSGKSRLAEQRAAEQPPVTYLATAQAGDAEMARRIARHRDHRAQRPEPWRTVEEPWDVVAAVRHETAAGTVLVECLTLWLTNRLLGLPDRPAQDEAAILAEVDALAAAAAAIPGRLIVVSHETGLGVMPANALARRFGDLLCEANQRLARAAQEVLLCVAGLPLRIK
jgi:adenosylcobinamide kinase/adenosylcobinamide-phosphate guanylyltransferase